MFGKVYTYTYMNTQLTSYTDVHKHMHGNYNWYNYNLLTSLTIPTRYKSQRIIGMVHIILRYIEVVLHNLKFPFREEMQTC